MARSTSFNNKWAAGGDKTAFAAFLDRVNTGWEGGVDKDAPRAPQQNAWQYRADDALQDIERQGVMGWLSDSVYGLGAPTFAADGNYYESLQANNSGNDPTTSTGFWRLVGSSFFSGVPVGTVIAVAHNGPAESGWLKCNGASVSRTLYARLFQKLGTAWGTLNANSFYLPDFRGEFLRGFDDGRGADRNRGFASLQLATMIPSFVGNNGNLPGIGTLDVLNSDSTGTYPITRTLAYNANQTSDRTDASGNYVRPRNQTVVYWIKY